MPVKWIKKHKQPKVVKGDEGLPLPEVKPDIEGFYPANDFVRDVIGIAFSKDFSMWFNAGVFEVKHIPTSNMVLVKAPYNDIKNMPNAADYKALIDSKSRESVMYAINHALAHLSKLAMTKAPSGVLKTKLEKYNELKKGAPSVGHGELFDDEEAESKYIKLSDATKLYEEVRGTNNGSPPYVVVALSKEGNLAARCMHNGDNINLSVRFEGPIVSKDGYTNILAKGYLHKMSTSHASVHVSVTDDVILRKTLASIITGLLHDCSWSQWCGFYAKDIDKLFTANPPF